MRHRLQLLVVDLCLIGVATILALLLRDNFETSLARLQAVASYLVLTLIAAALTFPLLGTSRTIWRLSAMPDYLRLLGAVVLTVVTAVALGFVYNRLDGIARALPLLQGILMLVALVGMRVVARLRHAARARPAQFIPAETQAGPVDTVLLVAGSRLGDLYLRAVADLAPGRVHVAGILHRDVRQSGRLLQGVKILGTPADIGKLLGDLEVEGQAVSRVVVAVAVEQLLPAEREALLAVEQAGGIAVELLAERLGLDGGADGGPGRGLGGTGAPAPAASGGRGARAFVISEADLAQFAQRPYWRLKRAIDLAGAFLLLILLAPFLALAAALAIIDVGYPFLFAQYRPGVGGRPFRLYKLRTMAAAHDGAGRRRPDAQRTSAIGRFLRRTRLDELPQLINILRGQMAFVGPRPLLPADQPPAYAARLLVRPGLTGWAQVKGGRAVSADNKAALDVWYLMHASLGLDLAILWHTARMIVVGERINAGAIRDAWRDLRHAGVCSSAPG